MLLESCGENQGNKITSYSNERLLKKQKVYAAEEDTDNESRKIVGLVTEHVSSANRRSNWVVASGGTCRMCNNEELFDHIIDLEMPQEITVGDGHSV